MKANCLVLKTLLPWIPAKETFDEIIKQWDIKSFNLCTSLYVLSIKNKVLKIHKILNQINSKPTQN